jgi:hypothetical protein
MYNKFITNNAVQVNFQKTLLLKSSCKPQSFFQLREGWKRHPFLFSLKRKDTAYSATQTEFMEDGARPKTNIKQNGSES